MQSTSVAFETCFIMLEVYVGILSSNKVSLFESSQLSSIVFSDLRVRMPHYFECSGIDLPPQAGALREVKTGEQQ